MEVITLRETYDENMRITIRLKQNEDGSVYYAIVGDDELEKEIKSLAKPIFVHIRSTDKCNLRCPYCYTDDKSETTDMTDEQLKEIIKKCDENGVLNITWTGGEPFVRNNICELINCVYETGINQTILTNGTLINNNILEKLPKDNITLQISLNQIWDNNPSIEKRQIKILENAQNAIKKGFNVIISIIFKPVSISEYEKLIKRLIDYEITAARFGFEIPVGGLSNKDMYHYIKEMKLMFGSLNKLRIKYMDEITLTYQFDKYCLENLNFPKRFLSCEAGTTQIYIDNNGDVYPCPLFKSYREFKCGNVFDDSWQDLWSAKPMEEFRNVSECKNCNVLCTDWCRALLYPIKNTLEGKSMYCNMVD